uniref:Uncharacterized protein n=1 Tax=Anguilla anguilla TaxID=7936 RepID=A0A0E9P9E9_ANGAN
MLGMMAVGVFWKLIKLFRDSNSDSGACQAPCRSPNAATVPP